MNDVRELFNREKSRFSTSTEFAISVSKLAAGRKVNIPNVMASYVFTRVCVGADSLRHLLERDIEKSKDLTLDHYSTAVLARNIVEGSLMVHYLLEDGVSDEQWALRGKVLNLHDASLKLRLFKSLGATKEYASFKEEATTLREEISQHPAFTALARISHTTECIGAPNQRK